MMKWRLPCRSVLNSILPPLISVTALATSGVTVPVFGFGIRPRGPSTRPRRPTLPIMSGVATTASKSRKPPWMRSIMSSEPTKSAPAARASSARSPVANASTRAVLPVPWGRLTVPRTIWSALRGFTPSRSATSTVGSNLADEVFLASATASAGLYSLVWSICSAAARYALLRFMVSPSGNGGCGQRASAGPATGGEGSALNGDPHRPGGPGDDLLCCFHRGRVEVGHLGLRDLPHLRDGDRADLGGVRGGAALGNPGGLLDQFGGRRGLRNERKRPVLVDCDLHRDDIAALGLRRRVVLLAEVHDVDAVRAQCRAHRRRRSSRARVELHLDYRSDLLLPRSRHQLMSLTLPAVTGACLVPVRSWRPGRRKARPAFPCRRSTPAP